MCIASRTTIGVRWKQCKLCGGTTALIKCNCNCGHKILISVFAFLQVHLEIEEELQKKKKRSQVVCWFMSLLFSLYDRYSSFWFDLSKILLNVPNVQFYYWTVIWNYFSAKSCRDKCFKKRIQGQR